MVSKDDGGSLVLTDTERLERLIAEGAIPYLRAYSDGKWTFDEHEGESPREVIDKWLSALDEARTQKQ